MAKLINIDLEQLAALCRLKPTLKDVSAFFDCSEDTIERRIKEYKNMTFAEFRDQNMAETRFNLVRKALQKAESGDNVMLIFCLKNLCNWGDKPAQNESEGLADKVAKARARVLVKKFDLEERIKQLEDSDTDENQHKSEPTD